MAEKVKVKVNDLLIKIKKYGALLPALFFSPYFFYNPSISKCQLLMIVIVYYYLCFMGPVYFIKFLIEKLDLKQKYVDVFSWFSGMIMYGYTVYNWIFVFMNKSDFGFATAIFMIPFIAFLRVIQVIVIVCCFMLTFNYLSKKMKKEEV